MSQEAWKITLLVSRKKDSENPHFQSFLIDVTPDEYVLDAVERVWAFHDRSLTFRHACHHSTCGACGMLVNGVEKLTCITTIKDVVKNGGTLKVEPLRNFPVVSDLVVDMGSFYQKMERTHFGQVTPLKDSFLPYEQARLPQAPGDFERLVDCIECGLCVSACPAANTSSTYMGPAILAGIQHKFLQSHDPTLLDLADHQDGVWRCHSAYECSAVCPSNVDPAWRIMDLRKKIIGNRLASLFNRKEALKK